MKGGKRPIKKGSLEMWGLIIIGIMIMTIVLILHSIPWYDKALRINEEAQFLADINDHTSLFPVILKNRGLYTTGDIMACTMTGNDDCRDYDMEIERLVSSFGTKMSLYTERGVIVSYGHKSEGDPIYADVPLPGGTVGKVSILLDSFLDDSKSDSVEREYSDTYGNCLTDNKKFEQNYLTTIDFMGKKVRVHKAARDDFLKVVNDIKLCEDDETKNYDFWNPAWGGDAGGTYNCRKNRNNPSKMSMHAYGMAIDINPWENPNCPKDPKCNGGMTYDYNIPDCVIDAFKKNNFKWGGDFNSVKDYMHFEWVPPEVRAGYKGELSNLKENYESEGDEL